MLLNYPDVNEGIENRIIDSAKRNSDFEKVLFGIKSKRYTLARIKRIVLSSYLGITKQLQNCSVPYIRVLGMTDKGLEVLKIAKKTATLPIVSEYSQIKKSEKIQFLMKNN